ncbi:MAG: hypothetical protein IGS48_18470 [Oscillatoriales cyanobacterium C42_A2020_001]|jgi:hypothetical protein|nr:hypothetical protein [Leptolyngbyaceae cyanobacterium C42_A2020_001]
MSTPTREEIIALAQEIAERMGVDTLRREDFFKNSAFTEAQVYRLFPDDGWRGLLEAANLRVTFQNVATPDESLLSEFHRVVKEMGCIPTGRQLDSRSEYSFAVYKKRFGGIQGTLKKYHDWLEQLEPNAPELQLVQIKSKHEIITQPAPLISNGSQQWTKSSGVVFGAPISFRGLRHAPTNEQGVVYLFGMVSYELGLIVEAVQSAYPDCEAKRCVDSKRNRWQRVRIEFEFCSSNFKAHGHDPKGCDMIVCWEHDWQDCPLEVIELRSVIDQLEG